MRYLLLIFPLFFLTGCSFSEPQEVTVIEGGFCVDNDNGHEQYKYSYENQLKLFTESNIGAVFSGVRQDIIGCVGDDYYQFRIK